VLPELTGYTDRFSVRQGEHIRFMVSTDHPTYDVAIVRLIQGDENPRGPWGYKEQLIETAVNQTYSGRSRLRTAGLLLLSRIRPVLQNNSLTLQAWVYPTLAVGRPQGLLTKWVGGRVFGLWACHR